MGKIHVQKTNFTVLSNIPLRDKKLSLRSKGLLAFMLSLPENWDYTIRGLESVLKEGRDAIRSSIKELEESRYVVRRRVRDNKGVLGGVEYDLYMEPSDNQPKSENPTLDKPTLDEPTLGNSPQINKEGISKEETSKETIISTSSPDEESKEEFILTNRKKKLKGKRLEAFKIFWDKFKYKSGRADAAQSWLDIPELRPSLCEEIYAAAELEAKRRPALLASGKTPKMAQGWITSRRWEDEDLKTEQKEGGFKW